MTTKKTAPKKLAKAAAPVTQEPIPLQSKIIGGVIALLFVGFSIFWFFAKSKVKSMEGDIVKHFESRGFTIEKGDISFSGFPFSVKATIPKVKVTRGDARDMNVMLDADEVTASVAPWRPGRVTVDGPMTYGIYMGSAPILSLKVSKIRADITFDKGSKFKVSDWKIYDTDVSKGDLDQKVVSIGELALSQEEKKEGVLTRSSFDFDLEKVNFALTPASSMVVDEASLSGAIASPYKSAEELSEAIQSFNKTFNAALKKRCAEKSEFMPSLKSTIESLEAARSRFDVKLSLKGGAYMTKIKIEGRVKNGFPQIILTSQMENVDKFLEMGVEAGLLSPSISRTATLLLSNLGTEKDGKRDIEIRLEDRKLQMGDRVVWEFKDLDFDKLKLPLQYCERLAEEDSLQSKAVAEVQKGSVAGTLAGLSPPV